MKPALFTQMSTGPTSDWAWAMAPASCGRLGMSASYPRAVPPWSTISLAVSAAPSALRSRTTSLQPSEAKARQSAFPRLRAPPVTRATRPLIPRSMAYLPLNWAGRFWKNAWMPSPPSHQPRKALGAAVAGNDPQVGLGLAHPRRLLEDADVAGHGDLASAAQRMAIDGGDDGLGEALDAAEHGVAEADEGGHVGPR